MLVASQNSALTIEYCILSHLKFADEIIVVDNGSTDDSINIIERLAQEHPKVSFINAPDVQHLYENRQIAYEHSKYRWIVRGDSDFIAWNSGPRDILKLRKYILALTPGQERPVAMKIKCSYVEGTWQTTLAGRQKSNAGIRIYQDVPGMRFGRMLNDPQSPGRWEGVILPGRSTVEWVLRHSPELWWLHANVKTLMPRFLRTFRTNWRQNGDFDQHPTLVSYAKQVCKRRYGTSDLDESAVIWDRDVYNGQLVPYTGEYPEIVGDKIDIS